MLTNSTATTLRDRLKNDTRAQHQDAENRPIEQAMAKGVLEPETYVALLGQRFLVHQHLENVLEHIVKNEPRLQPFVTEHFRLAPIARADLKRFGVDPDEIEPLQATANTIAWIESLAQSQPIALLGPHYVFEGSKNGGRFICRSLIKAWGDEYAIRLSYLDPHGDEQPALWKQFCEAINHLDVTSDEQDDIVEAAAGMFDGVARMDDELAAKLGM